MRRHSLSSSYPSHLSNHVECMREILLEPPNRGLPDEPSHLVDHVYIGSQSHAESLKILRKYNITHVLNCAGYRGPRPEPNASPYVGIGIEYKEFQADDEETYDITQHFTEAFQYLDNVKRQNGTALVHCALGINRSAATCVAYIMHHKQKSLFETTRLVKRKRKVALTNRGFQIQLVKFAKTIGLLDVQAETEEMRIDRRRSEELSALSNRVNESGHYIKSPSQSKNPVHSVHASPARDYALGGHRSHCYDQPRQSRMERTSHSLYYNDPNQVYRTTQIHRDSGIRDGRNHRSPNRDPLSYMMKQVLSADDDRRRRDSSRARSDILY